MMKKEFVAGRITSQTEFICSAEFDRLKLSEQKREVQRLKWFIREYRALKNRAADSREGTLEVGADAEVMRVKGGE